MSGQSQLLDCNAPSTYREVVAKAWSRPAFATPAARLTGVTVLIGLLLLAQFALLFAGGKAVDGDANRALDDSLQQLADVSEQRVVDFAERTEQVIRNISSALSPTVNFAPALIQVLNAELTDASEVDAIAVTYPNGECVGLERSKVRVDGRASSVTSWSSSHVLSTRLTEYGLDMVQVKIDDSPALTSPTATDRYREAVATTSVKWTVVNADGTGVEAWASVAKRDANGNVLAVVSAKMAVEDLSYQLNALPSGSGTQVVLLSGDRTVITSPRYETAVAPAFSAGGRRGKVASGASYRQATPYDAEKVSRSGRYVTLERGMANRGPDWVIHIRASELGLNRGFAQLKATLNVVLGGLVVLTVALVYLLYMLREPIVALRDGAGRDPLTGLHNRRYADATAKRMVRAAHRAESKVVIAMFDLDNFKLLNDELGHSAGDRALEDLSRTLSSETRGGDLAVRWGGDEFLLVMTLPMRDNAGVVVERIRVRMARSLAAQFPDVPALGITAGFAVSNAADDDVAAIIAFADSSLVEGKMMEKGRSYGASSDLQPV